MTKNIQSLPGDEAVMTNVEQLEKLEKLRPCGYLETYSTARHYRGYYNNVGLTATYTSSCSNSRSLKGLVYAALRQVIAKHSVLSAIALDEDKSYPSVYFARLLSIDLRTCVEFQERKDPVPGDGETDKELEQLLTDQHARNYKDNLGSKPFWRLAILSSHSHGSTFTAAWIFHHALADGSSAFLFHNTFLAALNSRELDPNTNAIVEPPTKPLPPPFEDLHPMPISWSFLLTNVAKFLLPSILYKRPTRLWTGNSIPSAIPTPPRFRFHTLVFSTATTQRLAQLSRREGVSVTATLQCMVTGSLFSNIPAEQFDKIAVMGPMAARPFLKDVQEDQMTNALTEWTYTHHREKAGMFSWEEARAVKSTILSIAAQSGRDNPIALLKNISSVHNYLDSHLGNERMPSFELSNIGVYKTKDDRLRTWGIGRMTFSQCANPTGPAFGVNVVTGGDGNATLNFCWGDAALEDGLMDKVVVGVREGVKALVDAEE
jgi:hypothetical protein